jgi:hypothetical protein
VTSADEFKYYEGGKGKEVGRGILFTEVEWWGVGGVFGA